MQSLMAVLILLAASADVRLPKAGEDVILVATYETGDFAEWDLVISEGLCLDALLCEDSSPEEFCFRDSCGCVTECQLYREPVCNLRAAYCMGASPPPARHSGSGSPTYGSKKNLSEEKTIERTGEQNSEDRSQKAGF